MKQEEEGARSKKWQSPSDSLASIELYHPTPRAGASFFLRRCTTHTSH
jgi:hypothetical protein